MNILQFPLTRITIAFVAGIILSTFVSIEPKILLIGAFMSIVVLAIAYFISLRNLIQRWYFGAVAYMAAFIAGCFSVMINSGVHDPRHYVHHLHDSPQLIEAVVRERLKPTATNERFVARISHIDKKQASGSMLLNFKLHNRQAELRIGSTLRIRAPINTFDQPLNPNQFDYGRYLRNKAIYAQVYVSASELVAIGPSNKDIWYYADRIRSRILTNLEHSKFEQEELAVLSALILGQQQDISKEVVRDYQYAGAVHILSVSGLHVGFILLFLNYILKFLPNIRRWSYLRLAIIIVSLWVFAVLAGLSPSVVRSVTMFSFVAVGMHMRRTTNIFHTLLVSILLILFCKPSFIFDVGFQLSYAALFFILWLQPLLSDLWRPKYKVIKYLWDILTVSFAAQLGTFPLSVYYFHQFPGLFFITNLVVIPFLSIIMALGVLAMLIALVGTVPKLVALALQYGISWLNEVIHWIASFENFVLRDIPFNWQLLVAAYFLIIAGIIWYQRPNYKSMMAVLIAIASLQITFAANKWHHGNTKEFVVFNIRKKSMIAERTGSSVAFYSAGSPLTSYDKNTIQSYLTGNFITKCDTLQITNVLLHDHKKILVVDSMAVYPIKGVPDILILTQSPKVNMDRLLDQIKPAIIVADGSNYRSYVALWKRTCDNKKIPFHATAEKGPFTMK